MTDAEPSGCVNRRPPVSEERTIQAVLEIRRGGPCSLDAFADDIRAVDVRFHGGKCHCEVTVDACGGGPVTKHCSSRICNYCPGIVFSAHECIPRFDRCTDGSFVIRTFAPDTATIADLVDDLRASCRHVRLVRLTDGDGDANLLEDVLEVDVSVLTGKQRAAFERAVEADYYEPTGGKTLVELAEEFDISKSALSQRLSRAEAKLMRQLVDGGGRC